MASGVHPFCMSVGLKSDSAVKGNRKTPLSTPTPHNPRAYNNYVGVRARFDQHRLKAFGFQARKCAKQR